MAGHERGQFQLWAPERTGSSWLFAINGSGWWFDKHRINCESIFNFAFLQCFLIVAFVSFKLKTRLSRLVLSRPRLFHFVLVIIVNETCIAIFIVLARITACSTIFFVFILLSMKCRVVTGTNLCLWSPKVILHVFLSKSLLKNCHISAIEIANFVKTSIPNRNTVSHIDEGCCLWRNHVHFRSYSVHDCRFCARKPVLIYVKVYLKQEI